MEQGSAGAGGEARAFPPVEGVLDRALAVVEYLREHCPWDRKQTARSLIPHLLEETHETVDAIHAGDPEALRGELGDLLLNFAFQVVVAEEAGQFTREEVVRMLEEKMIRRHPHLFGGEKESWEAIKARERTGVGAGDPGGLDDLAQEGAGSSGLLDAREGAGGSGVLDGLAQGLDALLRAHRIQEKVAEVGFDWDEAGGALAKVKEELAEVEAAMEEEDPHTVSEEMGDLLFAVVNLARLSGAHAVPALQAANLKFQRRFQMVEGLAKERGIAIPGASLAELDELWDEVKRGEGVGDAVERGAGDAATRGRATPDDD